MMSATDYLPARPATVPAGASASTPAGTPARFVDRPGASAVAWTGLVVGLLTVAVTLVPDVPVVLRMVAALGFAVAGPGAAVLAHLRPGPAAEPDQLPADRARTRRRRTWPSSPDAVVTWAMVVLASLTTFAGGTTLLVWTRWWEPRTATLLAAAAVVISCLVALVRARAAAPSLVAVRQRWQALDRVTAGHLAVLAAGTGAWLLALAGTDTTQVGEFGLLATVHPALFAALLLCAGGFVWELRRPGGGRGVILLGYAVLLILVLHGTTPALLDQPQYAWTYKHVGVVELLRSQGGTVDAGDLYQQWPSLFAAVAGLADLGGVAPLTLARWSPVFFNLAGGLVLLALGRTLFADRRVAYLGVFVYLCVNWVEEDYLSPQALAFVLSLGGLLMILRWLRQDPPAYDGWRSRLFAGIPAAPATSPRVRAAALAGVVLLFAVLTASHQLSPYLLIGQVATLAVLRLVRPRWLVLMLAAIAVGYLVPRWGLISGSFDIFDGLNIFANAGGNADGWGSTGQAFSAIVVRTLALSVWALTAFAVWRARHRLGPVLIPAVLAATPLALLAMQSYGGEAIYRVFLFSSPWCALLIAGLLLRVRVDGARLRRLAVWGLTVLALAGAALGTMQGRHGQLMVDQPTTAEVAAARYLYAHATPGATIATATSNFPGRIAGNYHEFNLTLPVGEPELVHGAEFRDDMLDRRYLPGIEQYLQSFDGTTSYLVVSDGMRRQADYFGFLPDGSLDVLEETLADAKGWSVFYRNQDVVIYQFDGQGSWA